MKNIETLNKHVIIGHGRVGSTALETLMAHKHKCLVIEQDVIL